MVFTRTLGWLAALALAAVAGLWSYAIASEARAPAKSLAVPTPFDGVARAELAFRSFAARTARDPAARIDPTERALALQGYRAEPLSPAALGIVAMAMTDPKDAARRQSLLENASLLSRRSVLVSNEMIKLAAARNDDTAFFTWLSRLMLTGVEARRVYGAAMAEATAKPGAVAALTPILGAKPRWADYYWTLVVGRPNSWVNAASLRGAVARPPYRQTAVSLTDQTLLARLVRVGKFAEAHALARDLGLRGSQGGALLQNGDFAAAPLLAPFDWELSAEGNLGASIDAKNKQMTVSAIGGASGAAARQILRLAPGNYKLSWAISSATPFEPGTIAAGLRCADPRVQVASPAPIPLTAGQSDADWTVPASDCQWYWFSIDARVPDGGVGLDAYLDRVSLAGAVAPRAEGS
ncbi:hypothetical protein [Sphingopyxis sp. H115]|uniref:hypothetical protein n=1 Tax=Sphingopyxis sp. H115 TaxID=1759073 RepID=UPI000ACF5D08|nr:hypothetical protein [Sphingopyxis sp. H115]